MSGSVTPYSITPTLGVGLNMSWSLTAAGSPTGTGPRFPTDAMQLGMTPGKVMQGSNAHRFILVNSGSAALAANASLTVGPPDFTQGGTGTGISATGPATAVPAGTLFWADMGV